MDTRVGIKHVLNLGAGVQSTTLYLMFMQGELGINLDCAIFADTGEEPKAVYKHIKWLESLNGPPIIIRSRSRLGDDLKRGENSTRQRVASIPAYTKLPASGDEGQTRRQCSQEYKVAVIERTIRRELYGLKPGRKIPKSASILFQYIGISAEEAGRAERLMRRRKLGNIRFPLLERNMSRADCLVWLNERGNVPHRVPRSACVFCPYHDDNEWLVIKSDPEDWKRAVEIDEALRTPGIIVNHNMNAEMFVHRSCQPLVQIDFRPKPPNTQQTFGFWRHDNFTRDCLGVCGV